MFRWIEIPEFKEFVGIIDNRVWRLRQIAADTPVTFHKSSATAAEMKILKSKGQLPSTLVSYFRLGTQLESLFSTWCEKDPLLREFFLSLNDIEKANQFKGLRLLNQNPRETIFAFITSANNNVPRISKLLNALSAKYGEQRWSNGTFSLHSFPDLEILARSDLETDLRKIGFGYRAKFIPCEICPIEFLVSFNY